jgi:GPH family glycoside/pentoside/hexuronide:cation symporter
MVLIGGAVACFFVLPPSVKADVIDYDELVTGERKEGSYFAVWNFIQKLASAAAITVSGFVLQFVGYEANVVQSEASVAAMRGLFAGLPLALSILAILLLLRFRLDASEHQRIRAELDRRSEGESL